MPGQPRGGSKLHMPPTYCPRCGTAIRPQWSSVVHCDCSDLPRLYANQTAVHVDAL